MSFVEATYAYAGNCISRSFKILFEKRSKERSAERGRSRKRETRTKKKKREREKERETISREESRAG